MMLHDDSMNKILQNEQMDLQARYLNDNERQVRTRYFDSKFLNHPNKVVRKAAVTNISGRSQCKLECSATDR